MTEDPIQLLKPDLNLLALLFELLAEACELPQNIMFSWHKAVSGKAIMRAGQYRLSLKFARAKPQYIRDKVSFLKRRDTFSGEGERAGGVIMKDSSQHSKGAMAAEKQLPPLLSPNQMPQVSGLLVPAELYVVLRAPALLAGMGKPQPNTPWQNLYAVGFRHLVRLAWITPSVDQSPLHLLWDADLEDLADGSDPHEPKFEAALINDIALDVAACLRKGEGVIVHCVGGRGRTGTVLGRTLRFLGYGGPEVVVYLDWLHKHRGKTGWPESHWQETLVRS